MDEEGIVLVLARASELRSKITNCIHNSSSIDAAKQEAEPEYKGEEEVEEEEEEEATESLLNIRDSLETLEAQLSSLQALQQQQWYEKEASLAEIDYTRKKLLQNLKTYKGEGSEVINEAIAFASSTVEKENNDLLLPPYPTRPSSSLASDNGYLSHFSLTPKIPPNEGVIDPPTGRVHQSERRSSLKGLRQIVGAAAKMAFTLVGFIAVLHLSGFEPRLSRRGSESNVFGVSRQQGNEEKTEMTLECPPGKVLVIENGETRCLVKERVEIPFRSVATIPDVNYGCGHYLAFQVFNMVSSPFYS